MPRQKFRADLNLQRLTLRSTRPQYSPPPQIPRHWRHRSVQRFIRTQLSNLIAGITSIATVIISQPPRFRQ